jgi:hypothetical protein
MTVPAMTPVQMLPVPVLEHPHWRVNYRPSTYVVDRLPSLSDCWEVLKRTSVRLRGWDFPHIPPRDAERDYGDTWVGGSSDFMGHVEYWRLYQSTQFLHLGSVRESTQPEFASQLRQIMGSHAGADLNLVPGFLSLTNSIYNITEFFEFAARLAQAQVYTDPVTINISINGIQGFMLAAEDRMWWSADFVARQPDFRYEKTLTPAELVASAAEHAIECTVWFFERFGWLKPNIDAIRTDQQKLLTRRF